MTEEKKASLKEKAAEELRLMLYITAFLAAVFVSFLTCRRLISRGFGVTSFHYGFAVIEALIVARVILIGKAIGVGKKSKGHGLFRKAPGDAVIDALLAGVFAILEHAVEGLLHHERLSARIRKFLDQGVDEILGRTLIMFVAFVPFFTRRELDRVPGDRKLVGLLFHGGAARAKA